ncbi:uncharacterized protein [Cicer arietinum]|uniref:uncharacterized protein isoform X1 n=1 Tax=Cicer arietinum TaxID=3827 RepID=UPI003CC6BB6A
MFSFLAETMETTIKSWHETSSVGSIVYFLHDKEKAQTNKYPPFVNINRACFYIFLFNFQMVFIMVHYDYQEKLNKVTYINVVFFTFNLVSHFIFQAFELPQTHRSCFSFLRQYAAESFSKAACLVTSKNIIAYPQVWKGQGSRKWKHAQNDGFFGQFEFPSLRKLWFISGSNENGNTVQGARRFGHWCS